MEGVATLYHNIKSFMVKGKIMKTVEYKVSAIKVYNDKDTDGFITVLLLEGNLRGQQLTIPEKDFIFNIN